MEDEILTAFVSSAVLLTVRAGAALRLVPFFGGRTVPLLPWLGLSAALGMTLASSHVFQPINKPDTAHFALLCVKELFIGFALGALARMAFSALEVVAEIARRTSNFVGSETDMEGYSALYLLLGVFAFFLVDGHHALISALSSTVTCLPPLEMPALEPIAGVGLSSLIRLFALALSTAVLISAPIFAAGLLADAAGGFLVRIASSSLARQGAEMLRPIAAQIAVAASMALVATSAVRFLVDSMSSLYICGP